MIATSWGPVRQERHVSTCPCGTADMTAANIVLGQRGIAGGNSCLLMDLATSCCFLSRSAVARASATGYADSSGQVIRKMAGRIRAGVECKQPALSAADSLIALQQFFFLQNGRVIASGS